MFPITTVCIIGLNFSLNLLVVLEQLHMMVYKMPKTVILLPADGNIVTKRNIKV